ncbi:MAG: oligogalacturonate-specific porin KdgM family protein [Escherichia coli]
MNSYLKISLAGITMLSCLSPTLVCAEQPHGFIDYRHEYLDDTRTHADRVEFGTFFSNGIGLMGELRYNTDEGDKDKWDPSQFGNNGTGLSVVYRFKPLDDKKFWLEPMFWLDTTQYWSTYEYGLSAGYDFSKEWKVSGGFIMTWIKPPINPKVMATMIVITAVTMCGSTIDHKKPTFQYQLNLVYYNNGYLTWNDGHKNYTASFKVGYKNGIVDTLYEYCGL